MGCAGSVAVLPLGEAVEECSEYRLGKELGRGAFAVVYDAVSSVDGSKWAIKIMQPQEAQNCQGEMEIMRLAGKHANVVSLRDTFMCGAQTCLTLELVSGGELFDFLDSQGRGFSEADAATLLRGLLNGVKHLHSLNIVHNDLKPENIMMDANSLNVKICDLGCAYRSETPVLRKSDPGGTIVYWAPEIVLQREEGKPVDIWAVGCVLYIVLSGFHPFDPFGTADDIDIVRASVPGRFDTANEVWPSLSKEVRTLIRRMLAPQWQDRITAEKALEHAWVMEGVASASEMAMGEMRAKRLHGFQMLMQLQKGAVTLGAACDSVFDMIDVNKDGHLDEGELQAAFALLGQTLTIAEVREITAEADADGDGFIDREEWNAVMAMSSAKKSINEEEELRSLFKLFDEDGSGAIDRDELKRMLAIMGMSSASDAELEAYMAKATGGTSDEITFEQFVKLHSTLASTAAAAASS